MPAPPPASFSLASRTLAAPAPVPPTRRSPFSLLRRTAPPGWFPAGLPSAELRPSAFSIRMIIHPQYPARFQDHLVLETDPPFRIILYWTILEHQAVLNNVTVQPYGIRQQSDLNRQSRQRCGDKIHSLRHLRHDLQPGYHAQVEGPTIRRVEGTNRLAPREILAGGKRRQLPA